MTSLASLLSFPGRPKPPRPQAKPTIVAVIDDQLVSRTVIARILRALDETIEVVQFSEPAKALAWLTSANPALIITDYRMPQMDGIEFVHKLRELDSTKWTPIVLVTVITDNKIRNRALAAGATDFLNKPIDHDECMARCSNLLELSRYQTFLLEQLTIRNAYIRRIHASTGACKSTEFTVEEMLGVGEASRYVLMEYQELYEITSTLAAMDKLLIPWRNKRGPLEATINRPLQGNEAQTAEQA